MNEKIIISIKEELEKLSKELTSNPDFIINDKKISQSDLSKLTKKEMEDIDTFNIILKNNYHYIDTNRIAIEIMQQIERSKKNESAI